MIMRWPSRTSQDNPRARQDQPALRSQTRTVVLVRLGATNADRDAIRADAEAEAARKTGDHERAARHTGLAAGFRAMSQHYRQQEDTFAKTMDDRQAWEQATAQSRHLALAADTELRRRHPGHHIEPLRSAEPEVVSDTEREDLVLAPDKEIGEMAGWIRNLAAERRAFRERLEERQALTVPNADPDWEDLGPAFPAPHAPDRDAILQPPKPEITPSARILELTAEREAGPEAGS